ncbi:MAG: hypothetical protein IKV59_01965 [Lachnospiraceae bacterium]|nr:hypothetical protein [Lachnospiraceae bacterium]MBR5508801.1 hypothetical protein [Lachnospiraceae bacterium]
MDKFEYKVRAEEIKSLIAKGDYAQAAEIADTIDWRRVKSVMMLCTISDLYKINRRYEDARDMLLLAYDRHPGGRTICYSLCELSIKMEEFVEAVEYYKEFVQIAPKDTGRYILQYKLYEAQDVSLEERIAVLEELKKRDYREKWAYELAYLYHRVGLSTRCVEECDELILWFGDGKYVIKALELKMLHQPLTPQQQQKYEYRFEPRYDQVEAAKKEQESGWKEAVEGDAAPQKREASQVTPIEADVSNQEQNGDETAPAEYDIQVKTVDVSQYNTINLQRELAEGLKEVLGEETLEPEMQEKEVFFGETDKLPAVEEQPEAYGQSVQRARNPFEEALSIEPDGQITLVMPDVQQVDKQITGQMNIEDVMREWERLKKEAELNMDIPDEVEEIAEIEEEPEIEEPSEEEFDEPCDEDFDESEEAEPVEEAELVEEAEVPQEIELPQETEPHIRNLSKEEKALFGPFIQNRSARYKLTAMLDNISMASYTGNVILTGEEGVDTMNLAKNIIRDVQITDSNFTGKTAKISGQALNQKDVSAIMEQLQNGALIIEKASDINEKTATAMYKKLQREGQGIIVVMEDTKKNMNKFLERNEMLSECFTARMDMEALSNETLVAFGKKYAREMEYSIDDLGVLALHTRIEELQTIDHAVTIMEVKEIIDEAIEHANKKNIKHFFDILMAKRYDDEDMIILRENDFI